MHIQERCFLLGLCLLGGVAFSSAVDTETRITTTPDTNNEEPPGVQPLRTVWQNDTTEVKSSYSTKEADVKATTETKKKPVMDFKVKADQKYQKPNTKDDDSRRNSDVPMTPSASPTTISTKADQPSGTARSADAVNVTIPFLLRGEPIVAVTKATPTSGLPVQGVASDTAEVQATEEATSSRGRALNISAPEPTNLLHANMTDLSDVSMDEDDKEVEGGEYIAPHNETAMNVSSTLLPRVPVCVHGNRTYSIGEKVVRDCEQKCVCSESGITNCQPLLCASPLIRAGKEIVDPSCTEQLDVAEPCCAILICSLFADTDTEPEETCVLGNKTVARKQRIEDGCRVCICEAGGHLKCQPKCANETAAVIKDDRCVTLPDTSDSCCTRTVCDVTLGDHEIKSENSTDSSVYLIDVIALNSTAIKVELSMEDPEGVAIEISENNHAWRQAKVDKDGIISSLEPAHTYYVRVVEGSYTGPVTQVSLPAEAAKTNMSEKTSDKNSCNYKGKVYDIGAQWYDECVFICYCVEGGKHECITIVCPTDSGLDARDPNCLEWEPIPPDFKGEPPQCCPQEVRCKNNGSCNYKGVTYDNFKELPYNVTGCDKRCHCELGKVTCYTATCTPPPSRAPANLPCPPNAAQLTRIPAEPCCLQWTCDHSSRPGMMNVTTAYPGPLATNTFDRQTIDNHKRPNNKSETLKPSLEPEHSTFSLSEDPKTYNAQTDATTHGPPHYPMDPGHPTVPYNGPYNPDFISMHPTVENVFHLPPEKPAPTPKEKSKSKSDAKKPVELAKPHKETIDQYFPGPLSPDRFPQKAFPPSVLPYPVNENQRIPDSLNPNKMAAPQKDRPINQPPFLPLNPNNGGNIPPVSFNAQFDNSASGLPPKSASPNIISPQKKIVPSSPYVDAQKPKPPPIPDRPKQDQEILPEHLYRLINSQHPGLIQPDHTAPQDYPNSYDQPIPNQKQPSSNRAPPGYFETPPFAPKKATKPPRIFAQKSENGQVTYHVHTPDIPNTQQIQELLAHINQYHSKSESFQQHPGQPAVPHDLPNGPPSILPLHVDAHVPHSGFTHLNLPFAAQTSNQSGMDHNIVPPGYSGNVNGFAVPPSSDEVIIHTLEPLDAHSIRLVFIIPHHLAGLQGRVELRYTSDEKNFDPSTWKSQVFAPPNDYIATPQLEFELGDLKPNTEYKVKITVKLTDVDNNLTSRIYTVRTSEEVTTLPPQIPIDTELKIIEANSTWVNVMWKKFTEYELDFIDGVQLRYKERDSKVYAATPLIHRAVTNYVIENLKPSTTYEVGIYFIPFPKQSTELRSNKTIEVTTAMEPDPYSFDVKVEIKTIKSTDVEVSWSGVPYPEDKYVNIYRAIYQSDTGKEDTSTFKIAKRDSHAKTVIGDLKPGTRYRLWLEMYLTNGRIKKSNVQDFITKPGVLLPATVSQQAGKYASLPLHEGDYYGPLVIVAIVASLAILSTLILLMMLMKRRTSSKADISPRKTTSAYDNPSYKTCEDVVTISNGRNKTTTDHEMSTINSNVKETA